MTVISKQTIQVLKNFASINNSIVIKPGTRVSTLSVNKNILAVANVDEEFENQISIYDLGTFISGLEIYDTPDIDTTNENYLIISDRNNHAKTKFFYSDPDIIVQAPDKEIEIPSQDVKFTLSKTDLESLFKAAYVYKVPDLCVYGHNGSIEICVTNKKNETSNNFSITLGETDKTFCYCFKVENLKMIPNTYDVTISNHNVALFESKTMKYWIALEPNKDS